MPFTIPHQDTENTFIHKTGIYHLAKRNYCDRRKAASTKHIKDQQTVSSERFFFSIVLAW